MDARETLDQVEHATLSVRLFDVGLTNVTMADAVTIITTAAANRQPSRFAFVNADCLNQVTGNAAYGRVLSRQQAVFADGSGVALAARLAGSPLLANVNGTDMFPLLCREAASRGLRIFLLGGKDGVAARTARRMEAAIDGLSICGFHHGFFSDEEDGDVIERINCSGADIVLVGMGAPRQELWIERVRPRLSAPVLIGVGGLFDYYSGRIPRAPKWLRRRGCEWLWRLAMEPRRLARRYLLGNPLFLWRVMADRRTNAKIQGLIAGDQQAVARNSIAAWHRRAQRRKMLKRMIDVAVSASSLAALSPLLLAVAAAIRLESPGPVLFKQQRIGKDGEPFLIWKFRSMYIDAEARRQRLLASSDREGAHFKMKHDPRITRVGRLIRRLSIDELPQLWNVMNGTMALVGPRPNLPEEVENYRLEDLARLAVKPGITCIWQVSGRAELPWERQVELDLDYVYTPSILSDLKLMLKTVPAVLAGKGAY